MRYGTPKGQEYTFNRYAYLHVTKKKSRQSAVEIGKILKRELKDITNIENKATKDPIVKIVDRKLP